MHLPIPVDGLIKLLSIFMYTTEIILRFALALIELDQLQHVFFGVFVLLRFE